MKNIEPFYVFPISKINTIRKTHPFLFDPRLYTQRMAIHDRGKLRKKQVDIWFLPIEAESKNDG